MGGGHLGLLAAPPVSRVSYSTEDFDICAFNGIKIRQYLTELLRFKAFKMAAAAILDFGFYFRFRHFAICGSIRYTSVQYLVVIG
jgi:hypothetical protein